MNDPQSKLMAQQIKELVPKPYDTEPKNLMVEGENRPINDLHMNVIVTQALTHTCTYVCTYMLND